MTGFLPSLIFVLIAEMGDKTQLVALSFAAKYKPLKVMTGITLATLVLFGVAALAGKAISGIIPMNYLGIAVGLLFIGFGVWTLRRDDDGEDAKTEGKFGVVLTVAGAFFLAELGDKTQLATLSLAAKYESFFGVWLGSCLGMVAADGLAVALGYYAGKKLPANIIRYVSAAIFILFGIYTLVDAVI